MTFPTLTQQAAYPLDPDGELEDVILRSPTDAGYEITRPRFTRARRTWGINYPALSNADTTTLRAFEQATLRNGADSFSWTHPISKTVYTVRLTGPISYARANGPMLTAASFTLREV
jgi:hypothetical protein